MFCICMFWVNVVFFFVVFWWRVERLVDLILWLFFVFLSGEICDFGDDRVEEGGKYVVGFVVIDFGYYNMDGCIDFLVVSK